MLRCPATGVSRRVSCVEVAREPLADVLSRRIAMLLVDDDKIVLATIGYAGRAGDGGCCYYYWGAG